MDAELDSLTDLLCRLEQDLDELGWQQLSDRLRTALYPVCLRLTGRSDKADDVLQEISLQLLQGKARFRQLSPGAGDRAALAWLHKLAANTACKHVRGDVRRQQREWQCKPAGTAVFDNKEDAEWLRTALSELSDKHREPIILAYFAGLDHCDMAKAMSCSVPSSRARLSRSMKRLRRILIRMGVLLALPQLHHQLHILACEPLVVPAGANHADVIHPSPVQTGSIFPTGVLMPSFTVLITFAIAVGLGGMMSTAPAAAIQLRGHESAQAGIELDRQAEQIVDLIVNREFKGQTGGVFVSQQRLRFVGEQLDDFALALAKLASARVETLDGPWLGQAVVSTKKPLTAVTITKALGRRWNVGESKIRNQFMVTAKRKQ